MLEVNIISLLAILISFAGLIGVMNWRAGQAQKSITGNISNLALLVERKDTESTKELHEHLEKVYEKINILSAELSKFKNVVASEYLKREHLEKELQKVERHILSEIKAALSKD